MCMPVRVGELRGLRRFFEVNAYTVYYWHRVYLTAIQECMYSRVIQCC